MSETRSENSPEATTSTLRFKICMIGCYAVGKTSLVEKFVRSIYSDEYHTTIGVKIDKKNVQVGDQAATCMIWDIAGEDEFYTVKTSYLRGMSGYFLVVDGTRRETISIAQRIYDRVQPNFPDVPFLVLANKSDLQYEGQFRENLGDSFADAVTVLNTSAKTGENVESAFELLVEQMLVNRSKNA